MNKTQTNLTHIKHVCMPNSFELRLMHEFNIHVVHVFAYEFTLLGTFNL